MRAHWITSDAPRALLALMLASSVAAGCSDDSGVQADSAIDIGAADAAVDGAPGAEGPVDTGPPPPDGPTPDPKWVAITGPGPAVVNPRATRLKDGRVLVTGGWIYKGPTQYIKVRQSKAWLFVPAKNSFVAAGNMSFARVGHTSTLLPDGRVLIAGGMDDQDELNTTELFDPTRPAASAWKAGPLLTDKRYGAAAATLKDGRVLIVGGANYKSGVNYLGSLEIYQPAKNAFQVPAAAMSKGRSGLATAVLGSGVVLLAGGDAASSNSYIDLLETFDPSSGTVKTLAATLTNKKSGAHAFTLPTGKVLITAGHTFASSPADDLYDPVTSKVTKLTHPGGTGERSAATQLNDGRVLVAGGRDASQAKAVRVFDGKGMSWSKLPPMALAREDFALVTLQDGSVLVVGGLGDKNSYPPAARLYHP